MKSLSWMLRQHKLQLTTCFNVELNRNLDAQVNITHLSYVKRVPNEMSTINMGTWGCVMSRHCPIQAIHIPSPVQFPVDGKQTNITTEWAQTKISKAFDWSNWKPIHISSIGKSWGIKWFAHYFDFFFPEFLLMTASHHSQTTSMHSMHTSKWQTLMWLLKSP